MLEPNDSDFLWIVVVGFIVAFILAFGIGANDVANSFGTSVGAKVLTLRQACVIATIFELAGAILIGARVSDTVRKGIIDINSFNGTEELAMIGSLSALSGTGVWLLVATFFNLPVSGTHSVVGATMGYALVAHGLKGIKWKTFALIAASWVVSPLMSGIISSLLFLIVRRFILSKMLSFEVALKSLPIFYAFTVAINFFSVFYKGSHVLHFDKIPLYGVLILSIGGGILAAVIVHFLVSPYLKKKILKEVYGDENKSPEFPRQVRAVSFTTSVSDPDVNSTEKKLTAIKEVKEPDEDGNQDENELNKVNLHISPASVEPPDAGMPDQSCPSPDDETPEPSHQFSVESTADSAMLIETTEQNGTGPEPSFQSSDAQTPEPNCQSSNVQMPEHSHQFSMESASESGMLIETTEQNGTVPSEAQKERARSRGMSLLMEARKRVSDEPKTGKLFAFLQILTASFGAFAHGGNDVSNAIGPLISLWVIYSSGMIQEKVLIPVWILVYGGVGICVGLFIWGRRVIKTVGEDLTPITPSSGFVIEIGSALTVLCASNLGIPISTTHCKVGSVVMVGRVRSKEVVDWYLFRNVILAWAVTMPFAGLISAGLYAALREAV